MRQLLPILTALTISLTSSGQMVIGLTANGGLSKLIKKVDFSGTVQKNYFMPSGHAGLFFNFHVDDKSLIGTDLLFVQIEGKEHLDTPETDIQGNPTGKYMRTDMWTHISYIGLPVYYGYKINKFILNLGFQTSVVLASSGLAKTTSGYGVLENTIDKLYIDALDAGLWTGLHFRLTEKFSIQTSYYLGLNNILKNNYAKWKIQEMTVGLRYNLFSRSAQTRETKN